MRKRVRVTTAMPVGSSDYKRVLANREILKNKHEDRMKAINLIAFSTPVTNKKLTPLEEAQRKYKCGNSASTKIFGRTIHIKYYELSHYINAGCALTWKW